MKIAKNRRSEMLALLQDKKTMQIEQLADYFGVSQLTIRRDLSLLEAQGVRRFHGGARFSDSSIYKPQYQRKQVIAEAAAKHISTGDTLFINSSSTALMALSHIHNTSITAITNNGKALTTPIDSHIHLVLCGGDISFPKVALTGEFALSNLDKIAASHLIMGVSGISARMGLSTSNLSEVAVNKMMLKRTTGKKIIVADSSKIDYDSAFSSAEVAEITHLITDIHADKQFVQTLCKMGIEVELIEAL